MIAPALAGVLRNWERKRISNTPSTTNQTTKTIGNEWVKKSLKVSLAAEPIKTFGGSPTSVPAPPVLDSMATEMR